MAAQNHLDWLGINQDVIAGLILFLATSALGWWTGLFGWLYRRWRDRLRPDEKTLIRWVSSEPDSEVRIITAGYENPRIVFIGCRLYLHRDRMRWLEALASLEAKKILFKAGDLRFELDPKWGRKGPYLGWRLIRWGSMPYARYCRRYARLRVADYGSTEVPKEDQQRRMDGERKVIADQLSADECGILLATKGDPSAKVEVTHAASGWQVSCHDEYFATRTNNRRGEQMKAVVEGLAQNGWLVKDFQGPSLNIYKLTVGGAKLAEYIHRQGPRS